MKSIYKHLLIALSLLLVILLWASSQSGQLQLYNAAINFLKPSEPFESLSMSSPPEYSNESSWLSLPIRLDESDLVPKGLRPSINNGTAPVDVFYIHGTGYTSGNSWTAELEIGSATEDNARFSLANEASIFNGCCNIYAPHYREASLFTYIATDEVQRSKILNAVYQDIESAFTYYLNHYNQGRPYIIVSHSQGTHHATTLVKELIDNSDVGANMVVAYLIGGITHPVSYEYLSTLNNISACKSSTDTHCIIHWDTFGVGGSERLFKSTESALCTNPLTWQIDELVAEASQHLGAASISGQYTINVFGPDSSQHVTFDPANKLETSYTWAQCKNGTLYVKNLENTAYSKLGEMPDKSYHGIDLPLFHMNIRANVKERISHFFLNEKVKSHSQTLEKE